MCGTPCWRRSAAKTVVQIGCADEANGEIWFQLTNPLKVMQLMGPSPLMTSGWIVRSGSQVQHARAVVVFDSLSEEAAHVELQVEDAPGRPSHRLHGKQPLRMVNMTPSEIFFRWVADYLFVWQMRATSRNPWSLSCRNLP